MSAPVQSQELVQVALSTIQAETAVTFSCGLMDGRLYYQGQHVGFGFIDNVKDAAEKAGITVYRRDEYTEGGFIGDGRDLSTVTLTTIKFKTAYDALYEEIMSKK